MNEGNLGEKRYNLFLSLLVIILALIFIIAFDLISYGNSDSSQCTDQISGNAIVSKYSLNSIKLSESTLLDFKVISIVLVSFISMYFVSIKGKLKS